MALLDKLKAQPPGPPVAPGDIDRVYRRWRIQGMAVMIVGYALYYFVRKNLSMAMPGMRTELGYTRTDLGLILTVFSNRAPPVEEADTVARDPDLHRALLFPLPDDVPAGKSGPRGGLRLSLSVLLRRLIDKVGGTFARWAVLKVGATWVKGRGAGRVGPGVLAVFGRGEEGTGRWSRSWRGLALLFRGGRGLDVEVVDHD